MNVKIYKYINLDYMDMMSDGDSAMKKVMLEMLLEELPQEVKKMADLLNQKNWATLSSVSHKMKSTLAFVGNEQMTNANKQIETAAKFDPNEAMMQDCMSVLEKMYPMIIAELQEECAKL